MDRRTDGHGQTYIPLPSAGDNKFRTKITVTRICDNNQIQVLVQTSDLQQGNTVEL